MENVYEQFFLMKYYGGWSFIEVYSLPVGLRNWFFERLISQKDKEREALEKSQSPSRQS
tara:strand:- start:589 stop:765 length:177 start_codon:yes stop_codon:yes gene_type:complete